TPPPHACATASCATSRNTASTPRSTTKPSPAPGSSPPLHEPLRQRSQRRRVHRRQPRAARQPPHAHALLGGPALLPRSPSALRRTRHRAVSPAPLSLSARAAGGSPRSRGVHRSSSTVVSSSPPSRRPLPFGVVH